MGFSTDSTVIHIKLTEKGREKLSRGVLRFTQFALGDSEIDYEFNENISSLPENNEIYRPIDNNPNIISFIKKNSSSNNRLQLNSIPNTVNTITNTADSRGFFNVDNTTPSIINDVIHTKQPDIRIDISNVTGGDELTLKQTSNYGSNTTEPIVGDYIMVRWVNPLATGDTLTFDVNKAYPYLFYKIEDILSGNLADDNLIIRVDREVPNFNNNGNGLDAMGIIYPNNNNREESGDAVQNYYGAQLQTDFVEDSVISFIENYTTPTLDVPVWNLSIVYTEEVIGVGSNDRGYSQYASKKYGGFVSYIQEQSKIYCKLGLIHYSNQSPSNNYGEGLYSDTPKLYLPHIMWHKKSSQTVGINLSADSGNRKTLSNLNLDYYDLVDEDNNTVGKVFNDMNIFVIEDQELLFAMSYKSNRSWTLPEYSVEFNLTKA